MKRVFTLMLGLTPLLFSCQKEQITDMSTGEINAIAATSSTSGTNMTGRENCEPFPFGILALNNGSLTSSNLNMAGSIGYCKNVTSTTNTNLALTGECLVHSNVANFLYSVTSYLPALGIQTGTGVDWKLDQSNSYATSLSANYKVLSPDYTYGSITGNKTINSACTATGNANTIVNISSLNLSGERLTLVGAPSSDDGFIINVSGGFTLSNSEIKLTNVRPERVLFNLTTVNPLSMAQVSSGSDFKGTILAPNSTVVYYNPDSFEGSIVAKNIYAISFPSYGGGGYSGGCGGGSSSTTAPAPSFIQATYCNGYQW